MPDSDYSLELRTQTGWGKVLARWRNWISPQKGWLTLDVGFGLGLVPALLAQNDCLGVDIDMKLD